MLAIILNAHKKSLQDGREKRREALIRVLSNFEKEYPTIFLELMPAACKTIRDKLKMKKNKSFLDVRSKEAKRYRNLQPGDICLVLYESKVLASY